MKYNEEILELKSNTMVQKLDKLRKKFLALSQSSNKEEIKSLEIIKDKYLERYNQIIKSKQYDDYKELDDLTFREIGKIELKLDECIQRNVKKIREEIENGMQNIMNSDNYQNFTNLDEKLEEIEKIETLKDIYSSSNKEEGEIIQSKISTLKFNTLYRRQVEDLVYKNGINESKLMQYSNEREKKKFIKILERKIEEIKDEETEHELVFQAPTEQVLSNSKLINRLIVLDMEKHPEEYINLLKAPIFNAHLCNIKGEHYKALYGRAINRFHRAIRNQEKRKGVIDWEGWLKQEQDSKRNVNLFVSLLNSILKNIITDKNIGLIECENLYNKFGFKCNPIAITTGQQFVASILNKVRRTSQLGQLLKEIEQQKQNKEISEDEYCEINLIRLKYDFENERKEDLLDSLRQNTNKKVKERKKLEYHKGKKKKSKRKKQPIPDEQIQKDILIEEDGILTTDILNMVIAHENKLKSQAKEKITKTAKKINNKKRGKDKVEESVIEEIINEMVGKIDIKIKTLEKLKKLKNIDINSNEFDLKKVIELLEDVNNIYSELDIKYNERKILPQECMPLESSIYPNLNEHEKYFEYLELKVTPDRKFIRVKDISDLPIDYDKAKIKSITTKTEQTNHYDKIKIR